MVFRLLSAPAGLLAVDQQGLGRRLLVHDAEQLERVGRRSERFTPVEIADADKEPLIRIYLKKWAWATGAFFDGLKADSPQADIDAAAPGFPVFRIVTQ